jgi:MFS family permease
MVTGNMGVASSSALQRDARLVSTGHSHISPDEVAPGVVIGRTSEAFDCFVFGIACALVFPALIFPLTDALSGSLYSFVLIGLAFVARPVGSVIFLATDRRHGRGVKLTVALFLFGRSTASIAFLPGCGEFGWLSIALLAVCRVGQGIALGRAWDSL